MTKHGWNESARALDIYRTMMRIRRFEEAAEVAHSQGKILGSLHLYIGEEGVAAGVCHELEKTDLITSTHRGHGHSIAKGASMPEMMAELFGRANGTCKGKGGSMHIADFSVGMLGANGIVGGGLGIAVGAAHGLKYQKSRALAACFFGDGAINRGPFLESLNWAQVFNLPVLFVCEDNGFAAFTETATLTAGGGPGARAKAIGLHTVSVNGNDAMEVANATHELVERIRAGNGPAFLHAKTYRIHGHTVKDKGDYRDQDRHARQLELDPIRVMDKTLAEHGLTAEADRIRKEIEAEIVEMMEFAETGPYPEPDQAYVDVQTVGAPV